MSATATQPHAPALRERWRELAFAVLCIIAGPGVGAVVGIVLAARAGAPWVNFALFGGMASLWLLGPILALALQWYCRRLREQRQHDPQQDRRPE